MKKTVNSVPGVVPQGWYSPAIRTGDIVFVAGITGIDPDTGDTIAGGTEAQIRRIFEQIALALEAHGASLEDIVKMTIYFTDRKGQWPVFDRIRREIFKTDPPATTGVGITELGKGAEVEIDAIAVVSDKA